MADRHQYHARPKPEFTTVPELAALCERLQIRATSSLLCNEPEQAVDIRTAAQVIGALLKNGTIKQSIRLRANKMVARPRANNTAEVDKQYAYDGEDAVRVAIRMLTNQQANGWRQPISDQRR
jgi:hypothetical protein